MILTEQEIAKISESCTGADWAYQLVRKTEAAVLEKLKAQEPVGYMVKHDDKCMGFLPTSEKNTVPVYLHPLPPDDVVQKYEELLYAVHRKFPDETRHQTALRYIKTAEAPSYTNAAMKEMK